MGLGLGLGLELGLARSRVTGVGNAPSAMAWCCTEARTLALSSSGESLICQKHKGGWSPRVECPEAACVARVCRGDGKRVGVLGAVATASACEDVRRPETGTARLRFGGIIRSWYNKNV